MESITLNDVNYAVAPITPDAWTLRATSRHNLFEYDPSKDVLRFMAAFENHANLLGIFRVTYDVFQTDPSLPVPFLEHVFLLRRDGKPVARFATIETNMDGDVVHRMLVGEGGELTEQYNRVRRLLALIAD